MVMLGRLHGDRWSSFGDHAGIRSLSNLLTPEQMKRLEIFEEFDERFLQDISPDVTVAEWNAGAVLFEEGTYLDLAFVLVQGEVEIFLAQHEDANRPIFKAAVDPTVVGPVAGAAGGAGVAGGEGVAAGGVAAQAASATDSRKSGDGGVTFLSSMDFDLAHGQRMRLGPGEIFGEIGALNGWPQSATARTVTACMLVQIRLPALRKIRRKSKRLKARLDELYRSRMLRQHLASTPLLRDCGSETIDRLASRVELVSCQPDDVVTREGEIAEHLFMVRSGFLKMSQSLGSGELVVSYAGKGATLGEAELLVEGLGAWQVTATSVGHAELVRIAKTDLLEVLADQSVLEQRLWDIALGRIKEIGFTKNNLQRSDLVEFGLSKGIVQGNSVLVIDLETCTRCDDCVRACTATHGGVPRFVREGEVHNGFLIARSCYHCEDPICLIGCPTGAIRRANVGAVVEIDPSLCIGCGACEQNCPYDAIVMHDMGVTWGADAVPTHLRGEPRAVASKCDLCYTSAAGPACVSSCPHGSSSRVASLEEFDVLVQAKRRARVGAMA